MSEDSNLGGHGNGAAGGAAEMAAPLRSWGRFRLVNGLAIWREGSTAQLSSKEDSMASTGTVAAAAARAKAVMERAGAPQLDSFMVSHRIRGSPRQVRAVRSTTNTTVASQQHCRVAVLIGIELMSSAVPLATISGALSVIVCAYGVDVCRPVFRYACHAFGAPRNQQRPRRQNRSLSAGGADTAPAGRAGKRVLGV